MSKRVKFNIGTIISINNRCTKLSGNPNIIHLPNFPYYTNSIKSLLDRVNSAKRKAAESETNDEQVIENTGRNAIIHKVEVNTDTSETEKDIINIKFVGSGLQYSKSITGTNEIMKDLELAILMSGQRNMYVGNNNLMYFDTCYLELVKLENPFSMSPVKYFTLHDGVVDIIYL